MSAELPSSIWEKKGSNSKDMEVFIVPENNVKAIIKGSLTACKVFSNFLECQLSTWSTWLFRYSRRIRECSLIKVILFFFLFWLITPSAFCEIGEIDPHFPRIANLFGSTLAWPWSDGQEYWKKLSLIIGGFWNCGYDFYIPTVVTRRNNEMVNLTTNITNLKTYNPSIVILPDFYISGAEIDAVGTTEGTIPAEWILREDGEYVVLWPGYYSVDTSQQAPLDYIMSIVQSEVATRTNLFDGVFYDGWHADSYLVPQTENLSNGTMKVLVNNWSLDCGNPNPALAHGAIAEDQINQIVNGSLDFEYFLSWYLKWCNESKQPTLTTITAHPRGTITDAFVWATMTTEQQQAEKTRAENSDPTIMRFGLCVTLLGNGYYAYDYSTVARGDWWWYKEYDAPLGYPKDIAYKNSNGTWQRDYEGGTVIVNGTNYDAVINFSSPHTDVSTEETSQHFTLSSFDGRIFTFKQATECTYSIDYTNANYYSSGGTGNVNVTTSDNQCSWTASSNESWITITSGDSGTGNGTVSFSVMANTVQSLRTGTMSIAGETFTVTQDEACIYYIIPTNQSFGSSGGTGSINVTTQSGCTWNASRDASWVTITSGSNGTGSGTVNYSVSANTSTIERTGMMTIAGQTFTVTQSAGSTCTYSISPTRQSFDTNVGNSGVYVTASAGCAWTATSNASWISITSGSSGTGSSAVNYSVSANTNTSSRTGIMTIAGQTFTITQQGTTCTYTIAPSNQSYNSNGGTGNVSITTQSNCAWTAQSNTTWITITSGSSGTGNGTVNYSVSVNTATSQRTGTLTIAGQTFTVTQQGISFVFTISPTSKSFSSSGGTGSINVTTQSGCTWNASSDASWLTITSGSNGTGSGTVNYSVSVNTATSQRTGTLTIAGQTFTVTQSAGNTCTYSISPTRQSFDANVGNSGVYVTTSAGCTWTATSNASWISITSGSSGTGSSAVNYSVSANTNTSSRTGIMTIAGQTFTITQQGTTCTYTIAPSNQSYNSNGGTGNVSITTQSNCAWTAQSNTTWITITSGSSGTGNGTVSFSVMANTIQSSRTGTMNIAGETFTVIQEGVQQAECSTWTEVINKITAYVSGQADWSDVITCYTLYAVSQ